MQPQVLLTNVFWSFWMQSRFCGAILQKLGLHKSQRNPSASPKSHSDMSHIEISPQGVGWGNIFNLNMDTIGPVRHRKNGLRVLKPQKPLPETRLSINTRYSPQLPNLLFSFSPSLLLSLSLPLCYVGLCIVIYTTSSFKPWVNERKIAQIRKLKAAEAWFFFWRYISLSFASSESGSGLGKPGTRPQCCCCWCGRFPVRSKNTFALAHFGPQPPVLFGSTTGMGENHIQLSNRDCGMPQCFFNHAPRLLHTHCTLRGSHLALFSAGSKLEALWQSNSWAWSNSCTCRYLTDFKTNQLTEHWILFIFQLIILFAQ